MKKLFYAVAAFALVLTGCAKELDNQVKDPFSKVRLHVTVADNMTKVSADNDGRYHWQAGDVISVLNSEGAPFDFETEDGGSDVDFGASKFTGTLGKYAMYPASDGHMADGDEIQFNLPSSYIWVANAINMPMLGKVAEEKATFKSVGGVLKLVCYNVPSDAVLMEFSATNKQISGAFTIADGSVSTPVIATSAKASSNNVVNFDFTGKRSDNMVFYIPLPTGTIDGFTVSFLSDVPEVLFTKTATVDLTVVRNQMIIAPDLNCAAVADAVLTNSEITGTLSTSYGTGSISSASGSWAYGDASKQVSKMQLKNGSGYLSLPTDFSNNIKTIILHSSGDAGGKSYDGTISFKTATDGSVIASKVVSSSTLGDDLIIDIPDGNKTGVIMTSGEGLRFSSVTVKFKGGTYTAPTITAVDALEIPVASGETNNAETAVSTSGELDALGLTATVEESAKSWLTATIDEGKLKVSAPKNTTGALREGKVTLRITGASKEVTVSQPNALVPNPTDLAVVAGNAKFTATWTGDANATSYVAYLRTTDGTPTDGTNITASITDDGAGNYSITDYAVTNDQEYFIYVKVNGVASNYVAPSEYVQENFTPEEEKGTAINPYSVSDAFAVIAAYNDGDESATDVYTTGTVKEIESIDTGEYGNASYTITDGSKDLYVYRGFKGYDSGLVKFTSSDQLEVGDVVVICGKLKLYGTTKEIAQNNYIVSQTKVHKMVIAPDTDIQMAGPANSVYAITVTSNYAWTAELNAVASSARGTSFDVLDSSDSVIDGTIAGTAGTTTIKFRAIGEGNADGSTINNYGTITFSDGTISSSAINIKQSPKTSATKHVATINFGSGTGDTNVNKASVSGYDSEGNKWTVTTAGTTSFTPNAYYAQIGSSSDSANSITFSTTLSLSATDISISAKFGGFKSTAGTVTLKVGDSTIGTGSLNATTDVTVSSSSTGSGTVLTVTVSGINKGVKAYWIEATYTN